MGCLFKKSKVNPKEQKMVNEWYEQMNREMESDPQFEEFSVSEEWDQDFREAMNKTLEEKARKQKLQKCVLILVACIAVVLTVIGLKKCMCK